MITRRHGHHSFVPTAPLGDLVAQRRQKSGADHTRSVADRAVVRDGDEGGRMTLDPGNPFDGVKRYLSDGSVRRSRHSRRVVRDRLSWSKQLRSQQRWCDWSVDRGWRRATREAGCGRWLLLTMIGLIFFSRFYFMWS
jgi:hypothetical protein